MSSNSFLFYDAFGGTERIDLIAKLAWKSFATPWSAGVKKNYCDTVSYPIVTGFDATKFMGLWYEQSHSKDFEEF